MTLNHSKTWPVSTLAVVQLRVDPYGRTYSAVSEQEPPYDVGPLPITKELEEARRERDCERQNGVLLPLSRKHLEMFTKLSSPRLAKAAIRTDTISTILDPIEFESERIDENGVTAAGGRREDVNAAKGDGDSPLQLQKFHILALTRIEENAVDENNECHQIGRRPSIKVDNWDFIYTETVPTTTTRCPVHRYGPSTSEQVSNRRVHACESTTKDTFLPPDLPLDARKTTTLRRHYYPEGGWGWTVVVCTVLVHVLNHGVQLSSSQLVMPGVEKFKVDKVHFAGSSIVSEDQEE